MDLAARVLLCFFLVPLAVGVLGMAVAEIPGLLRLLGGLF
jgi:hypothetical protein